MREKLETLPVAELREMAKAQGLKGVSSMRKAELIEQLCQQAEKNPQVKPAQVEKSARPATRAREAEREAPQGARGAEREMPQSARGAERETSQSARGAEREMPQSARGAEREASQSARSAEREASQSARGAEREASQGARGAEREASQNMRETYQNTRDSRDSYQTSGQERENGQFLRGQDQNQQPQRQMRSSAPYENRQNRQDNRMADPRRNSRPYDKNGQGNGNRYYNNGQAAGQTAAAAQNSYGSGDDRPRSEIKNDALGLSSQDLAELDSGIEANGILEVMPDGFGFIRCENFLPGENDVYVAPSQIRRFNLKTGDIINGNRRVKSATEKFAALLYIRTVNGYPLSATETRPNFEDLTPIFPNKRLHMECPGQRTSVAMRVLDLLSPIGKGQRGMIVSPPKAGKTTLLKQVAKAVTTNHPDMHLMILLIDERPEEVTDIKEAIVGPNVEVIYSTFDEEASNHKRVSEMVIERAKRLVEHGRDVMILLDSITRLTRAYNLTVTPSGRTLSGGLDPAALYMPKRFFGAARNMREGGSLTILATALVETGSRMDDVVYEEFKGTGNMELMLDRKLSEKRIFPAIDILRSGTRRDDLLLSREEAECVDTIRRATNSLKPEDAVEKILDLFARTRNNREFVEMSKKMRFF